jgi:hypothetical protein
MMSLSKYLCNAQSVGDWNGQEQRAADQLNHIYHALDERIFNVLVMGDEAHYHPDIYDEIMSHVWNDWAHNPKLLDLTSQQIEEYVVQRTSAYAAPPKEGYITPHETRVV